jgi:transcriptional regulator GlxA family with amidase domain
MNPPRPRRIGIIGYDGVNAIDLTGPAEAFVSANDCGASGAPYEVVVIGLDRRTFRTDSGVRILAAETLGRARGIDTLVIPGGSGLRREAANRAVSAWVRQRAPSVRRIASVCTGIYGLAATGLLDGRKVTTHWRFAADVAKRFPALRVERDAIFIRDGKFYTSAGVTAGIDLSLALIEEDHGPKVALNVARELVMYLKRPGGQEQFSEPLQFQHQASERFSDLAAWITGHLDGDLSNETLARRVNLCPRHFSRAFKGAFSKSPAAFVEEVRIGEASRRLGSSHDTIDRIARSVGFSNPDTFRRSFERRFRVNPSAYRRRFPQAPSPATH